MIERKVIFTISVILLASSMFIAKTGLPDSVTASLAVNQLSDDIVISSVSRQQARKQAIDQFLGGAVALGIGGVVLSFIPKPRRRKREC